MTLAEASGAAIIGFNVRAHKEAREAAERAGIEIRYYNIIYDLVDDVKKAMSGLLAPTLRETMLGNAQILEIFTVSKVGKIAGCRVTDGKVERGANVRLIRDNVVIHEGKLSQLKRFKDDAREVVAGQECGMAFENYQDMRAGDVIECYRVETVQRVALSPSLRLARPADRSSCPRERASSKSPEATLTRQLLGIDRAFAGDDPSRLTMPRHHHRDALRPAASQRQLRVGELIRHALADMLSRGDVHDPVIEGHMITVPEVRDDPRPAARDDLRDAARRHATPKTVVEALERNKKFLRGEIARRVNLKFAPDIRFRVDERFDEAERIEKILRTPEVRRDLEREDGDEINDRDRIADAAGCRASAARANRAPAQAREARRARLGHPRQAGRHDLDACGRGRQAPVHGASAPATPARSIRSPRAACRSRSAKRPRPSRS